LPYTNQCITPLKWANLNRIDIQNIVYFYHYGEIRFTDNQIRDDYLRNILKVKSGDPYDTNDLSTMTSDYSSSNWFSSVLVEPTIHEENKTVDLNVLFYPKKKNTS